MSPQANVVKEEDYNLLACFSPVSTDLKIAVANSCKKTMEEHVTFDVSAMFEKHRMYMAHR